MHLDLAAEAVKAWCDLWACAIMQAVAAPVYAPLAQWIEQRFPKPCAQVRVLEGALRVWGVSPS